MAELNQITFEQAMDTLVVMFPSWQREALAQILIKRKGHMESAVEAILMTESQVQAPPRNNIPQMNSEIERARIPYGVPNNSQQQQQQQQQSHYRQPLRDPNRYRGTLCELPNDFLRPPSAYRNNNMDDEQLALMLQNEWFQREALAALGSDMRGIQPSGQYRPRDSTQGYGNRTFNAQNTQNHSEGIPDMGILKGLSTMSAAAKAKLAELAERFQSSNNSGSGGFGFGRNKVQTTGTERERQTEMRRLMDDDEEDDEVIDFGSSNSRGQHSLNDNGRVHRKKDD